MNKIKYFLNRWFAVVRRFLTPRYKVLFVNDLLPQVLEDKKLYIVEEDGFYEQAAMLCPCGCAQVLNMNLLSDERPCWRLTLDKNRTATLHPSVWRKVGCCSHFWLRRGRIMWVGD